MTQGRHPDRYVIRELTGFTIGAAYKSSNGIGSSRLTERQKRAQAQCDALNEEHRRWMHGARWERDGSVA